MNVVIFLVGPTPLFAPLRNQRTTASGWEECFCLKATIGVCQLLVMVYPCPVVVLSRGAF